MLAANGPGVPYRRRAVICRCERYLAARVWVSARVVGSCQAHSTSRSGARRGGRGWDTTMVAKRVWVTEISVGTVYPALPLVVPSRLT